MNKRISLLAVAAALLLASSGCAEPTERVGGRTASVPVQRTSSAGDADSDDGVPLDLYTHCGIRWAMIRGTVWYAEHEMSDGNGNPPEGWGNPVQSGLLSFQSRTVATFTSSAGRVTFHRTPRSEPPFRCS